MSEHDEYTMDWSNSTMAAAYLAAAAERYLLGLSDGRLLERALDSYYAVRPELGAARQERIAPVGA